MEGVTGVKRAREEDSLKTAFLALCARKPDGLPASLALKALKLTPEVRADRACRVRARVDDVAWDYAKRAGVRAGAGARAGRVRC
ncbi:hypothetical protein EON67_03730 [archaeon]|nr:MAG: hypothetical protein EON67_03730 [archaeon]